MAREKMHVIAILHYKIRLIFENEKKSIKQSIELGKEEGEK